MLKVENKNKKERKKNGYCQHCCIVCYLVSNLLKHFLLPPWSSGLVKSTQIKGTASSKKAYWLFRGQTQKSKVVTTVISKRGNHHTTPASSTTDFLLQEQLAWCALFVKHPSSVNTKRFPHPLFLSTASLELKKYCIRTRIQLFEFWGLSPSFCKSTTKNECVVITDVNLGQRFNHAPCFGTTLDGERGTHTSHCSGWYCGKPGYKPRVLAASHLVPFLFQEEQEEDGQEHLTTFRISF